MSLPRKDVRAYLDQPEHAALKLLAQQDGLTEAQLIEAIIVPVIHRRLHDAKIIAAKAELLGITRNLPEYPGKSRVARDFAILTDAAKASKAKR